MFKRCGGLRLQSACDPMHGHLVYRSGVSRNQIQLRSVNTGKDINDKELVINPYGIQYLTPSLRDKVFGKRSSSFNKMSRRNKEMTNDFKNKMLNQLANNSLENFDLLGKKTSRLKPVDINDLPRLEGNNLEEHFIRIGKYLAEPYTEIINNFNRKRKGEKAITLPKSWIIKQGWHRYGLHGEGEPIAVEYPKENLLVFDVETLPKISPYPVMATCRSENFLYCWISPSLEEAYHHYTNNKSQEEEALKDWKEKQVQEFFQSENKEQEAIQASKERFETEIRASKTSVKETEMRLSARNTELGDLEQQKLRVDSLLNIQLRIPTIEDYLYSIKTQEENKAARLKIYRSFKNSIVAKRKEEKLSLKNQLKHVKLEIKNVTKEVKDCEKQIIKENKAIISNNSKIERLFDKKQKLEEKENKNKLKAQEQNEKIEERMKRMDINPVKLSKETLQCLIPLNPNRENKVVIGHNVSYDRARILEEYDYQDSNTFFLDTLSLHVSISGMCTKQRGRYMQWKKVLKKDQPAINEFDEGEEDIPNTEDDFEKQWMNNLNKEGEEKASFLSMDPWLDFTAMNSLKECAKHYCNIDIEKDIRDTFFINDSFKPIVEDIQNLISYCATDVITTDTLFQSLYPKFKERLPHPVSFSALKPMGKAFLPVKKGKWENYVNTCETMYQNYMQEIQAKIDIIIEDLLIKYDIDENFWVNDPWLSQLNWERIPYLLKKDGSFAKNNGFANKPMWYKQLSISSTKGINLTVKSQMIPIFLKLEYLGKPIVIDKIWMDSNGNILKDQNRASDVNDNIDSDEDVLDKDKKADEKEMFCLCIDVESEEEVKDLVENKNHKIVGRNTASGLGSRLMIIHPNDSDARTTNVISKAFKGYFENGTVASSLPIAQEALKITTMCSYWVSSRKRIQNQWVISKDDILKSHPHADKDNSLLLNDSIDSDNGLIIPSLIAMGTVTRRAVENTWLTASNIKANRIGSELKSLVEAPEGYAFVGADVDSEELWIGSLLADSSFENHGSTPLGWMCLEGTKKEGTDLHTTTGKILNCSRDNAKVFNYSRIYGAGKSFTAQLLQKLDPSLSKQSCKETTDKLYNKTKGYTIESPKVYYGGSESALFTKLNNIANEKLCRTPVLKARITECLSVNKLNFQNNYLTSRINWIIQSSGVDYLHLLLISMEYLIKKYEIDARLMISIHDEVRFMCKEDDKYRTSMALQISNLWTRAIFCQALNLDDLPQSCAFFSGVDIDFVLRKEVNLDCVTISNPEPIPHGKCLDIYDVLKEPKATLGVANKTMCLDHTNIDNEKNKLEKLNYSPNIDLSDLLTLTIVCEQDSSEVKKLKRYFGKLNTHQLRNNLSEYVLHQDYEQKFAPTSHDTKDNTRIKKELRFSMNAL